MKSRIESIIIYILFIALLAVYLGTFIYVFTHASLPNGSDEIFYTRSSESFVINNSLKAAFTYNGEGSVLFGSDVHGFAYPLVIGSMMKIIGWNQYSTIIINMIFIIMSLIFIFLQKKFSIKKRLLMSSFLLLSLNLALFSFTYIPEMIHVLFGVILFFQIYKYSFEQSAKNKMLILTIILIAGFFRSSWMVYSALLIPFSINRKELLQNIAIFILFVIIGFIFTKLFMEPWVEVMYKTTERIKSGEFVPAILGLGYHIVMQIYKYITPNEAPGIIYLLFKYINIFALVFFVHQGWKKTNKLLLSMALAVLIHHISLITMHGVHGYGGIRHLFPTYLFFIFALVIYRDQYLKLSNILILVLLLIFPFGINHSYKWINNRISYAESYNNAGAIEVYGEIRNYADKDTAQVIFIDFLEHSNSFTMNAVPLRNDNNIPIRYIMRYYPNDFDNGVVDYVITKPGIQPGTFNEIAALKPVLVFETKFYDFYKVKK